MEKIGKKSAIILSFLIAVVLWAYVSYQENPEMTRWIHGVPITVIGTETLDQNGFSVVDTDNATVDVKLRGERLALTKVSAADISATLDVSSVSSAGTATLSCNVSVNKKNVEVSDTRKSSVNVTTEKIITDIYPVSTNIVGTPAKGYSLFEPLSNPTEVTVRGAESVINQIASVSTKSVSVNGVSNSNSVTVGMTAFNEEGTALSGITFDPASVEVTYTVLKEKSVSLNVPLTRLPPETRITYEPQTVLIYGSPEALASISEVRTESVDAYMLTDGSSLSLSLSLPYGIYASAEGGDIVTVTFSINSIFDEPDVSGDEAADEATDEAADE